MTTSTITRVTPSSAPAASRTDRAGILVVDDDSRIRRSVQLTLEDEGYHVATAGDGREAAQRVTEWRPALVILDMGLPDRDGADVAQQLRTACGKDLPILLITADGRAQEKAQRAGAFASLHKPFDLNRLVELVETRIGPA